MLTVQERIRQLKRDFSERLDQKKAETALSFFNRCTEKDFNDQQELIELKRTKEALDISLTLFQEIISNTLGGE